MKSTLFLILALLPAFAFAGTYRETRTLDIPAAGLNRLNIQCGAGSLTVRGVEGADHIKVTAMIESEGADSGEFRLLVNKLIQLDLKRVYDDARLVSRAGIPPLTNIETRIHLTVQLPANLNVRIIDGSGDVEVSNIIGNLFIDDDSGAINATNITGRVLIKDGSGAIAIMNVQGRLDIIDGSGKINVQHVTGDVTIIDASGGIEVNDIGGSVTVSDGSGSIDIYRVAKNVFIREPGSGKIEVDGVQGKVTIREYEEKSEPRMSKERQSAELSIED
jgi:DUF4097 and DUF4098 domain-containing protein YvlB